MIVMGYPMNGLVKHTPKSLCWALGCNVQSLIYNHPSLCGISVGRSNLKGVMEVEPVRGRRMPPTGGESPH